MKNKKLLWIGIGTALVLLCSCIGCLTNAETPSSYQTAYVTETRQTVTETALLPLSLPPTALIPSYTPSPSSVPEPTNTSTPQATEAPLLSTPTHQIIPTLSSPMRVHFVDVGQGDAILIQGPDGETGLIDGGETNTGIVQYLQSLGIKHLDLVIATHPHSDHIGGLVQVLKAIPVDRVITNGVPYTTLTYEHFLDAISASKAEYIEVKRGDTISLGSLEFTVLSPTSNTDPDMNNGSIVLRLVYGKVSFLFTGDAQEATERNMIASGLDVSANILKVAHHGSRTGSPPEFLSAVQPQIAIYSAGLGNDYGHPHPETIAALKAVGAKIYGTDVNGTIIVTTDGNGYSIETDKQGQPQAPPVVQPTLEQSTGLTIDVVSLTSPIAPGGTARLTIKTTPGAACTITAYFKSGPSQAAGLGPQTADVNGNVTWSWKVGSRTTPGIWRIVVTADLNGQSISKEIPFEVRK